MKTKMTDREFWEQERIGQEEDKKCQEEVLPTVKQWFYDWVTSDGAMRKDRRGRWISPPSQEPVVWSPEELLDLYVFLGDWARQEYVTNNYLRGDPPTITYMDRILEIFDEAGLDWSSDDVYSVLSIYTADVYEELRKESEEETES